MSPDRTSDKIFQRILHHAETVIPGLYEAGAISRHDARFLYETLRREKPHSILEIGVASGFSSAFILAALENLGLANSKLVSIDTAETCYFDPAVPVGRVVHECGLKTDSWQLHTGWDVSNLHQFARAQTYDLVFIDGHHAHPYCTLDFVSVLPLIEEHSTICIHDINLPTLYPSHPEWGPSLLFHNWPGSTTAAIEDVPNIGAMHPGQWEDEWIETCRSILRLPWDIEVPECYLEKLADALATSPASERLSPFLEDLKTASAVANVESSGLNDWCSINSRIFAAGQILHPNHGDKEKPRVTFSGIRRRTGKLSFFANASNPHSANPGVILYAQVDDEAPRIIRLLPTTPTLVELPILEGGEDVCITLEVGLPDSVISNSFTKVTISQFSFC